jgi:glycosyltransferase involved in cell wall biosynthesis
MKIAHLIDTLSTGGAEKLLVTMAKDFPEEMIVISLRPAKPNNDLSQDLEQLGVDVTTFTAAPLFNLPRILGISRHLTNSHADIIHSHLTYAIILGGICSVLTGKPLVVTLHNVRGDASGNPIRNLMVRFILRFIAKKIIAVGESVALVYKSLNKTGKLQMIPNAVEKIDPPPPEAVAKLRKELLGPTHTQLLIAVGRLMYQKAYHDLISAMVQVRQQLPNVKLVIAGVGHLGDQLSAQIDSLNIGDTVELLGLRDDVPELLAASDIFVMSSHWEGLPLAALEAMAMGLPLIATSVGELPYLINKDNGILVDPGQPRQLGKAIIELLKNPERRKEMGQNSRKLVEEKYRHDIWQREMVQLYSEVLNG